MSNFLDYNTPTHTSGLYTLLKILEQRYLPKGEILSIGPIINNVNVKNNTINIQEGYYNIVSNPTRGLYINIEPNKNAIDDRTYIQFRTGNDISAGLNFNKPISWHYGTNFVLESNKLYVIKITQDPINNGYLMEWYKTND